MGIAILLGFAGGIAGGIVDTAIARVLEVAFAFPVMLLALLLIAIRGPSVNTKIIAVGIASAPGYARMVRGQVLAVRQADYIAAATALGHGRVAVIRRHLFPNAMRPLVAVITLGIGQSIVWASGLAFLGLGVAPPSPDGRAAQLGPNVHHHLVVAGDHARPGHRPGGAVGHLAGPDVATPTGRSRPMTAAAATEQHAEIPPPAPRC